MKIHQSSGLASSKNIMADIKEIIIDSVHFLICLTKLGDIATIAMVATDAEKLRNIAENNPRPTELW